MPRRQGVALVLAMFGAGAFVAGLLVWPVVFGAILLAALFVGAMYAALFVWPHEEEL